MTDKSAPFAYKWLWLGIFGWLASLLKAISSKLMRGHPESAQIWILSESSIRKTNNNTATKGVIFRGSRCPICISRYWKVYGTQCSNSYSHLPSLHSGSSDFRLFCFSSKTSRSGQDSVMWLPFLPKPSHLYLSSPSFPLCGPSFNSLLQILPNFSSVL